MPIFLANDWHRTGLWPSATKARNAVASKSQSPDAKPWYAMSKTGNKPFALQMAESSVQCSGFGSTPVGLCAQAWKRTMSPSSNPSKSAFMPSQLRP